MGDGASVSSSPLARSERVPAITAAVVVKDRRELMERCLEGLFAQRVDGGFEIIVVDNGSTDGTFEMLEEQRTVAPVPMEVIRDDGSLGRIRNIAWRTASAPIVAFADSDCVPADGWLAAGLEAIATNDRVGVVQGCTLPDPGAERRRWDATQELTALSNRYEACNIFYRVEALRVAGGFDEAIGFFGEDTAAGWAVLEAGWRAGFEPRAVVHHAVTFPGLGWHLRRALGYGNINTLIRRFPAMRSLLFGRVFLRPRNAAFTAAVAGLLLAPLRPVFLVLAGPYAWLRRPRSLTRRHLGDIVGAVAFDAAVFCGLVRGSMREKTIVL